MDWSSRDVEIFLSVSRTLNFTASARALGMAQSAVSRGIADLERRLGCTLLSRNTRGMTLTPAGGRLAADLSDVASRMTDAWTHVRAVASGRSGRLRIGWDANCRQGLHAAALACFVEGGDATDIKVGAMDSTLQREALQAGLLDVAFMLGASGGAGLSTRALARLAPGVLWPEAWPGPPEHLLWIDLAGRPRIGARADADSLFDRTMQVSADAAGGIPPPHCLADHPDDALPLVTAGVGYLLACGAPDRARPGMAFVPLGDGPPPLLLSVGWRRNETDATVLRFIDCVLAVVEPSPS